ncbi:MAG: ABC transporter ATP-binding protein [Proteobacteria bacterium]|nr:ABC transporter ATP-binding protein [Pseudomonadota bacterium]MBI3499455.1 ABC transporter ATP-binding protein [Pseudomonadota bacterium]
MAVVRLIEISKRFPVRIRGAAHSVLAVDRVSLTVGDGEIVAIIGPSGCGKTTALRIVMGLETATSGRVLVDEREVRGCGYDRGMVFQQAQLLPWLTALQNVMFALELKGMQGSELRDTAVSCLDLVGLADSLDRRPHQLSGGMQQRVGIARALAIDPKVLLLDEPFGAIDAQTREGLQEEFLRIHASSGKTVLFVTHDLDEAVLVADRVAVMREGRLQEIIEVPLERPRGDSAAIRALPAFVETRHLIWQALRVAKEPVN